MEKHMWSKSVLSQSFKYGMFNGFKMKTMKRKYKQYNFEYF